MRTHTHTHTPTENQGATRKAADLKPAERGEHGLNHQDLLPEGERECRQL